MRRYWEEAEAIMGKKATLRYSKVNGFALSCGAGHVSMMGLGDLLCSEDPSSETGLSLYGRDYHTPLDAREERIASLAREAFEIGEEEAIEAMSEGKCELKPREAERGAWEEARARVAADEERMAGRRAFFADPLAFKYAEGGMMMEFFEHCRNEGMTAEEATERWNRIRRP